MTSQLRWQYETSHTGDHIITIRLWPYRSLSLQGFKIVMTALSLAIFSLGLGFYLLGAWPVIGFLGIEIGLVWLVFRMNYNAGRNFEQISITPEATAVEKVGWRGDKRHFNIPSPWIKASCIKGEGRSDKLILKYHSEQLEIGSFLPPREKSSLADALNESFERMRGAA